MRLSIKEICAFPECSLST